jgi:hypothetical protein
VHWIENVEYPPDLIAAMSFMYELRYEHPLFIYTSKELFVLRETYNFLTYDTYADCSTYCNNTIRCLQPTALKEREDEDGQEEVDDGEPRLS